MRNGRNLHSVSTTFTVYFDGQFWVGVAERRSGDLLEVARVVFGAEPSNEEIYRFVLARWTRLRYDAPTVADDAPAPSRNPKRRQRAAARETARARPSTKAQEALARERERHAESVRTRRSEDKREQAQRRFDQKQEKRRRKHRGR